ncbi:hypothetical protein EWH99_11625 [Sporolactobacillus sp. THM7-7]|nr:hypothetical protein EWH99_11625 [Sporolactobacillus sp. THM7-7]
MAQLIKINQCVSRYQMDFLRYARRFVRVKKRRLAEWTADWTIHSFGTRDRQGNQSVPDKERDSRFFDWLFEEQLRWAANTPWETSALPEHVRSESWLKTILRTVADQAFIMYRPVLAARAATVELDSLLITGDTVWCIRPLIREEGSVFQEVSPRKWREIATGSARDMLNPRISMNRTRSLVSALLDSKGMRMKIASCAFAPDGYIEFAEPGPRTFFIDCRNKNEWYRNLSIHSLIMKKEQIAAVRALLKNCGTVSVPRFQEEKSVRTPLFFMTPDEE